MSGQLSSSESEVPTGPVAWQQFGKEWAITGQYRDRPIFLIFKSAKVLGSHGLLRAFDPELDCPQFIVDAINAVAAVTPPDALSVATDLVGRWLLHWENSGAWGGISTKATEDLAKRIAAALAAREPASASDES